MKAVSRTPILFANVLVIATCGLLYELQAATLASYVLGDSVTQYSLVIGLYLSALGVGAWLSGFIEKDLARVFLEVELGVALLGGFSVPLLYLTHVRTGVFVPVLYASVLAVGTLVGLELPLLMRIASEKLDLKDMVSRVLTFDYVGSLAASLLFPLFLVPELGLVRTSLLVGVCNAAVALWGTWLLRPLLEGSPVGLRVRALLLLAALGVGLWWSQAFAEYVETASLDGHIAFAKTTPYQRIAVTESKGGFSLFLNAHHQFFSGDEYRYHEALAHPALLAARARRRVLILGGGDGLALREALRYPDVEAATLVDIDPEMTGLSARLPRLAALNGHAYDDPRTAVVNADALVWLDRHAGPPFDVVLIDFPDPHSFALGKLYTTRFYRLLRRHLADGGAVGIQATSPLTTRRSFWCVIRTMEAAGLSVRAYHAAVPSFGVWGFGLAKAGPFAVPEGGFPPGLRYLDGPTMRSLFEMPPDVGPVDVAVNRLDNQHLVRYYEQERRRNE
ncbi:MAG: polyamine aminopropyltransferase [Gemmataceae bacterium]